MTTATIVIKDEDDEVYLYQNHSGSPDMMGKRLKAILQFYDNLWYRVHLQVNLIKQPLLFVEPTKEKVPADYTYVITLPKKTIDIYDCEGKRVRMSDWTKKKKK